MRSGIARGTLQTMKMGIYALVALGLLAGLHAVASAQEDTPKREVSLEPVVVTATRTTLSPEEPASSASILDEHAVRTSANIVVDDILKTIPGFSLYRRSSSMITPPDLDTEAQGVTLRNVSTASRSGGRSPRKASTTSTWCAAAAPACGATMRWRA